MPWLIIKRYYLVIFTIVVCEWIIYYGVLPCYFESLLKLFEIIFSLIFAITRAWWTKIGNKLPKKQWWFFFKKPLYSIQRNIHIHHVPGRLRGILQGLCVDNSLKFKWWSNVPANWILTLASIPAIRQYILSVIDGDMIINTQEYSFLLLIQTNYTSKPVKVRFSDLKQS